MYLLFSRVPISLKEIQKALFFFFFRGSIDPLINPKRWATFIVKPETRCRKEHDLHLFFKKKHWIVLKPASFLGCLNHFVDSRSGIDYFLMGLHGLISSDIYIFYTNKDFPILYNKDFPILYTKWIHCKGISCEHATDNEKFKTINVDLNWECGDCAPNVD